MAKRSAKRSRSEDAEAENEEAAAEFVATEAGPDDDAGGDEADGAQASELQGEAGAAEGREEEAIDADGGGGDSSPSKKPREDRVGAGDTLTDEELESSIAALLFVSPEPISVGRLAEMLDHPRRARIEEALEGLGRRFAGAGLPFVVRPLAGGWRLLTAPEVSDVVTRLGRSRKAEKLSPAALETLAIIAYRQPATKAEIEAIRGVQAGAVLRALVDRGLVKVAGRSDQPGGALEYGTTPEFLDRFGLGAIEDLPRDGELLEG